MSGIFSSLFGSSPKVTQQAPTPTTSPAQQNALNTAFNTILTGGTLPGVPQAGPLASTSLAGLENVANATAPTAGTGSSLVDPTQNAFLKAIAAQAPMIDPSTSSKAFQEGVVQPLTQDFTQYTIPAITGRYGQSAGAAGSSDALAAREQAGTQLGRTLAQTGAQYTLGAEQANQDAQLKQSALLTQLLGVSPTVAGLGTNVAQGSTNLLTSLLGAGEQATSLPFSQNLQLLQALIQGGTAPTIQQGNTVASSGSTGLLGSLLGSSGFGSALGDFLFS